MVYRLIPPQQHPALLKVKPWRGAVRGDESVDFLGVHYVNSMVSDGPFNELDEGAKSTDVQTDYPPFDEEYFEWIDLIEAVACAKERFTMVELGAGFGRWLIRSAFAVRLLSDIPFSLVGVEAEPQHYRWLLKHFSNNGVNPSDHVLINSAVSDTDEDVWFMVGQPASWYGQRIATSLEVGAEKLGVFSKAVSIVAWRRRRTAPGTTGNSRYEIERVKAVTLHQLLVPHSKVDLVDLDVQGAELKVLSSAPKELVAKVKRVHVGTHSSEIESGLRKFFGSLGWTNVFDFPCLTTQETPFGTIKFLDGVQSWVNPNLSDSRKT